jgi:asparagine synthase (glutamine-hydrolysing)
VPTWAAFGAAKPHCKVVLTGDGADEVLCGYPRFGRLRRLLALRRWALPDLLTGWLSLARARLPQGSVMEHQIYRALAATPELLIDLAAAAFRPREVVELYCREHVKEYDPREHVLRRLREVEGMDPLSQARYLEVTLRLPEQMLFKVERASMAHSLEARPFFLSLPLLEYGLSLPTRRLVHRGGKYLLKRLLEDYVPVGNLYRKKQGFGLRRVQPQTWFDIHMNERMRERLGFDYIAALRRANAVRAVRLHFGARSLFEWYRAFGPAEGASNVRGA